MSIGSVLAVLSTLSRIGCYVTPWGHYSILVIKTSVPNCPNLAVNSVSRSATESTMMKAAGIIQHTVVGLVGHSYIISSILAMLFYSCSKLPKWKFSSRIPIPGVVFQYSHLRQTIYSCYFL